MTVLILVLVEDGLGGFPSVGRLHRLEIVLILVLVEDGLGAAKAGDVLDLQTMVLILVLVEDGLGDGYIQLRYLRHLRS